MTRNVFFLVLLATVVLGSAYLYAAQCSASATDPDCIATCSISIAGGRVDCSEGELFAECRSYDSDENLVEVRRSRCSGGNPGGDGGDCHGQPGEPGWWVGCDPFAL